MEMIDKTTTKSHIQQPEVEKLTTQELTDMELTPNQVRMTHDFDGLQGLSLPVPVGMSLERANSSNQL